MSESTLPDKVTLYNKEGTADKVYTLWIEEKGDGYVVNAQWGRRGGPQQSGTKTPKPVSREKAEETYKKVLKQKQAKGYHPGEDAPSYSMVEGAKDSGFRPMLLTPGTEDDIPWLVKDNAWGAQQKMNGKHLMLKSTTGKVVGINKRGLECPIPTELEKAMKGKYFLFDGELVGNVFYAFDLLALGENAEKDLRKKSCDQRHRICSMSVKSVVASDLVKIVPLVEEEKDKEKLVKKLRKDRKEGVVFKKLSAIYHAGRANKVDKADCIKIKFYAEVAAEVIEWTGKSSVEVGLRKNDEDIVSVGKVTVAERYQKQIEEGAIVRVKYLYATDAAQLFQAHLDATDDGSVIADQDVSDPVTDLKYEGKEDE